MKWRNLHGYDCALLARSYHRAAAKLACTLDADPGPIADFDLCPVLSAYRHAIELHLKVIVLAEGGNFLAERPDEISVHKTRSLSWLLQFVLQVITTLGWEDQVSIEGIDSLAEFKSVIAEANHIDGPFSAFRCPAGSEQSDSAKPAALQFIRRLDAAVTILALLADSLAAEWDLRSDPDRLDPEWPGSKQSIQ